ncbi:MAG: hypothetical protein U9P72_11855 [Campylobacterota bacterium]|nr:hypothetical protein [Campylobacterota bacterium]
MKIFVSVLLIIIGVFSLNISLDNSAMELHDEVFERAMIAFGLAKGLNGVISLIQGTQLSFAPVGIGINLSVGEILDPFNDMVERFSWVMLMASISLGIQKLFLILSSKIFLQVAISVSIVFSLVFIWIKKVQNSSLLAISLKLLVLLLLLRFGAIVFLYSSELLYTSILQAQYNDSSKVVELTKEKLQTIQNESRDIVTTKESAGIFEKFKTKSNNFVNSLNILDKLKSLEQNIEEASRKIINLITIFLVQTILMPLLYLWLLLSSIKFLFRVKFDGERVLVFSKLSITELL